MHLRQDGTFQGFPHSSNSEVEEIPQSEAPDFVSDLFWMLRVVGRQIVKQKATETGQ